MSLCLPSAYKSYVHTTLKSGKGARELCLKKQCASSKNTLLPKNASRHLGFRRVTTTDQHNKYNCSEEVWWELLKSYWEKKNDQKIGRNDQDEIQRHKVSKCHWKSDAKDLLNAGLAANLPLGVGAGREAVSGKESKVKGNKWGVRLTETCRSGRSTYSLLHIVAFLFFVVRVLGIYFLSKFQYPIKSFISFYF